MQRAKQHMINKACTEVWRLGVPWAEAFDASKKAIEAADAVARPVAKGRGRGKGKSKGQSKGRGKGKVRA